MRKNMGLYFRNSFLLIASLSFTLLAACGEDLSEKTKINKTDEIAIHGYDTVAYFTESKPVEGKPEHTFEWKGAKWQFASAENLNRFKNDPEKYSPEYGGFCAYAIAAGDAVDIDPEAWNIVDGKLYLNYDKSIQEKWVADQANYIKKGDEMWKKEVLKKN